MMDAVLRSIDKEFCLPENYSKGHGDVFKHWMKKYHPRALLLPVAPTFGSIQDLAVEGAAAVYWNRRYYVTFLDQCLEASKDNILQENVFYILTSEEMIALTRVFSILYFTVRMPMRWIAGNTHNVGDQGYDWSVLSTGKTIYDLEEAMVKIEDDGALLFDEAFMSDTFSYIMEGDNKFEPLKEYIIHMFGKYSI